MTTRQQIRKHERDTAKAHFALGNPKPGPGRQNKWLQRHPKIAPYYNLAWEMLRNGERSQAPKWKAIRKMMVALAVAPKVRMIGVGIVPYQASLGRHERGSWRSFPRVVIDANLQVAQ